MIKTEHLTKRYDSLVAVDDLSFSVGPGEILGFLGPNGAGKSTSMRMIAGFIAPTSGSVSVCGHDLQTDALAAKSVMGYLPEGAPSYGEMTVRRFLDFIADLRALNGGRRRLRLDYVIERLHLGPVLEQAIETLSKGFRRRVGLAQAIIHDPQVLVLDEPTDGLDPNQKHEVRALIGEMARDKIIVISTHILEEVNAVCNRAIIIARGRILADDSPQALEARSRYHNAVSLRFNDATPLAAARDAIALLPPVARVELNEREARLTAFPRGNQILLPSVSELAARERWSIKELHLEAGRLDEVFRAITESSVAESSMAESTTAESAPTAVAAGATGSAHG
jgi:ABC-2 type transport system ATP-binding protein